MITDSARARASRRILIERSHIPNRVTINRLRPEMHSRGHFLFPIYRRVFRTPTSTACYLVINPKIITRARTRERMGERVRDTAVPVIVPLISGSHKYRYPLHSFVPLSLQRRTFITLLTERADRSRG